MDAQEFRAELEADQRGTVRIRMPFDPTTTWGSRPRQYIRGTIDDTEFSGSLGSRGGQWYFPVNKALQKKLGAGPGSTVRVRVEPGEPEEATVPGDLTAAMAGAPGTGDFFAGLSGFYQRQYVEWIEGAKSTDTRATRVATVVRLLGEGRKQR
ncbi:YdeI/OmpD-associated family protein [Symbioplanes lichenis]|uniref:YdeI/OmpD-associated family protein n=1 Tax=Symbioplanes lichenis TaxID=1629072 RepID=UPI002739F854|nr:YdeI/OmpD-associated family protein [Actinoplanes lichenis]